MWEALLMLRLIASAMPIEPSNKTDRQPQAAKPTGMFTNSIRLAYAAYRLSLPVVSGRDASQTPDTGQTDDQKNIA